MDVTVTRSTTDECTVVLSFAELGALLYGDAHDPNAKYVLHLLVAGSLKRVGPEVGGLALVQYSRRVHYPDGRSERVDPDVVVGPVPG